jgi:threonine/homoserine/homoserine lactone efflux protein
MLPADLLLALVIFAFVALITPGPNNIMLMASGVNFGLQASLPHLFGIFLGFLVMIVLVGLGIGSLFAAQPWLHTALKTASALYMLWLAWRLAQATEIGDGGEGARPIDPPPVKWSIPMYGFIEEDRDAEKASQAGGDRCQASSG